MQKLIKLAEEIQKIKEEINSREKKLKELRDELFDLATEVNRDKIKTIYAIYPVGWFDSRNDFDEYLAQKWPRHEVLDVSQLKDNYHVSLRDKPEFMGLKVGDVQKRINAGAPSIDWSLLRRLNSELYDRIFVTETKITARIDEEALSDAISEHPEWAHDLEAALLPKKPTLVLA